MAIIFCEKIVLFGATPFFFPVLSQLCIVKKSKSKDMGLFASGANPPVPCLWLLQKEKQTLRARCALFANTSSAWPFGISAKIFGCLL